MSVRGSRAACCRATEFDIGIVSILLRHQPKASRSSHQGTMDEPSQVCDTLDRLVRRVQHRGRAYSSISLCPDTRPNRNLGRTAQLGRCWIAARYSLRRIRFAHGRLEGRGHRHIEVNIRDNRQQSATPGVGVELGRNSFDRAFGHNGRTRLPDGQPAQRKRPGPG